MTCGDKRSHLVCLALFSLLLAAPFAAAAPPTPAPITTPRDAFQRANTLAHDGDLPGAIAIYRRLASAGTESASLYWNWAQAAAARGAVGEALWALLRGREVEPGDAALSRELGHLRELANLDPAELSPQPLAGVARVARRLHLGLVALVVLVASLLAHALARLRPAVRWPVPVAWSTLVLGLALAVPPLAGSLAKPCAVVVEKGTPLVDAASPSANTLGTLREGEVVPILDSSGDFMRVQDSSGARGWVSAERVWRLDRPPSPPNR